MKGRAFYMSESQRYQVDHLLLLVGANPLPNMVAGKLLVAPGGKITLIHSGATKSLAGRLGAWLQSDNSANLPLVPSEVEESDAGSVYRCVEKVLKPYERGGERVRVGLHYTGGTKVMSVHAYRALEHWATDKEQSQEREALFSYLDAQRLCMRIERIAGGGTVSFSVGQDVKMSLDDLVDVHGWKWQQRKKSTELLKPIKMPILPEIAAALLAVHQDVDGAKKWETWLSETLYPQAKKQSLQDWKKDSQLQDLTLSWPDQLPDLCQMMKRELGQAETEHLSLTAAQERGLKGKDFCKWLDGMWLESVVLSALQSCSSTLDLGECCMDLHLVPHEDQAHGSNSMEFEFDVVALRGYQLFAFSCTTASHMGLLKHKLFEVCIRARQMGGDEACAALVCCAAGQDTVDKLKKQVRYNLGPQVRLQVFGRKELANLTRHIEGWVSEESRGK